jgi:hypothetical protein
METQTKLQLIVVDRPDLEDKGDKGDQEEKVAFMNCAHQNA